jgi:hypothetical protein
MRYVPWLVRAVALAAMLVFTPVGYRSAEGLHRNRACSAEHAGCTPEFDSICTAGGEPVMNFYNRTSR